MQFLGPLAKKRFWVNIHGRDPIQTLQNFVFELKSLFRRPRRFWAEFDWIVMTASVTSLSKTAYSGVSAAPPLCDQAGWQE